MDKLKIFYEDCIKHISFDYDDNLVFIINDLEESIIRYFEGLKNNKYNFLVFCFGSNKSSIRSNLDIIKLKDYKEIQTKRVDKFIVINSFDMVNDKIGFCQRLYKDLNKNGEICIYNFKEFKNLDFFNIKTILYATGFKNITLEVIEDLLLVRAIKL